MTKKQFINTLTFFYKQLGSGFSPESCLYFQVFGVQSCLMIAQWFDLVTYAFEECNNLQDSKSIFMICDFRIFPIMLLRQLNFGVLSVSQLLYVYCKGKTPPFFICSFYCRGVATGGGQGAMTSLLQFTSQTRS